MSQNSIHAKDILEDNLGSAIGNSMLEAGSVIGQQQIVDGADNALNELMIEQAGMDGLLSGAVGAANAAVDNQKAWKEDNQVPWREIAYEGMYDILDLQYKSYVTSMKHNFSSGDYIHDFESIKDKEVSMVWNDNDQANLLGLTGNAMYGPLLGKGFGAMRKITPPLSGRPHPIFDLTGREVWDIRAYKGTPIKGKKVGRVDAIEDLVKFDRLAWREIKPQETGSNLDKLQPYVLEAHSNYPDVSVDLLNAVIVYESKGAWNAISPTGAIGVMQLTSDHYVLSSDGGFNPFRVKESIHYAAKLLNGYIKKYGADDIGTKKVLVAYNQGEGYLLKHIEQYKGKWVESLIKEGSDYVKNIPGIQHNSQHIPGYFGEKR